MGEGNLTIRTVLCDIYNTLLEVGPPPADAEKRWEKLCRSRVPAANAPGPDEFAAAAERIIARAHTAAKASGIPYPEIFWPAVAREAWPGLVSLDTERLDDFLFEHAQLRRNVRLMPGAAEVVRALAKRRILLGLISNSQPYTLRELDTALAGAGLKRDMFVPDLCFFSFEHGFSKPDPHVFQILTARLARRGIAPAEALVVGDRDDNDIRPAQTHGFQAWRIANESAGAHSGSGDWLRLLDALKVL